MLVCKICDKKYSKLIGLSLHLIQKHNLKLVEYYVEYENFSVPICKCGKHMKYKVGLQFQETCGKKECLNKLQRSRNQTEITKLRISNSMKKLHIEGKLVGWAINKDINRRSYPEKFFIKLMSMNNIFSEFTIKEKMPFGKYFLDFAFLEIKTDVEIDGQQHFITQDAIEHDINRDKYLLDNGWRVYRIAWSELKANPNTVIDDFLSWLSNNSDLYHKYNVSEILSKLRKPPISHHHMISKEEKNRIVDLIINSGIDFSEHECGWVKKISEMIKNEIGLSGFTNVYRWVKSNMTEFYESNCYKKNSNNTGAKKNKNNYQKSNLNKRREYFLRKESQYNKRMLPIINKIKNSGIDFSKEGWVKKISKIIGISENKGGWWMRRNMKEFYEKNCWIRKSKMRP